MDRRTLPSTLFPRFEVDNFVMLTMDEVVFLESAPSCYVTMLLRVTSDKDQKMPELEKIDFLRTQPSEAY